MKIDFSKFNFETIKKYISLFESNADIETIKKIQQIK